MEQTSQLPTEQDENRDQIWREIAAMIQSSAKSVQSLTFGEFKLAFQILKEKIKRSPNDPSFNYLQNKENIQMQHDILKHKKALIKEDYQNNLNAIHQLEEKNQEHPRVLLILEISAEKLAELDNYVEHSKYNLNSLQNEINMIQSEQNANNLSGSSTNL